MIDHVKLALRISTNAFDAEINLLINDCLDELQNLGIISSREDADDDPQITNCCVFYCKWKFGDNDHSERWEKIYHEKVTRLMYTTGYGFPED